MHAKSILAILATVAACGVSVMAGPTATASSDLVERGLDESGTQLELVEREMIDSPVDVEARSFDDDKLSARDIEDIDARDIAEDTISLEAREPHRKRKSSNLGYGPKGFKDRRTNTERRRQRLRKIKASRRRNARNRRNGGRSGAPSPSPGPAGGGYPPGPPTPGPPEDPPAIAARSIFRRRPRATTPLTEKQQTRVASLDKACSAIGNKKSNRKCKGLVNRLRKNMSHKNALIAEITKMSMPLPAAQ